MKKLLITLLAVFYLGVSSGATVHFHYCMGELIEWSLSKEQSQDAEKCSNCGMSKGNAEDCCKDKDQQLKVKDSLKVTSGSCIPKVFAFQALSFPDLSEIPLTVPTELQAYNYVLPQVHRTPVFIRNCNFRI